MIGKSAAAKHCRFSCLPISSVIEPAVNDTASIHGWPGRTA